jgi:branched-chain amino acid transport system substrate-binding protein
MIGTLKHARPRFALAALASAVTLLAGAGPAAAQKAEPCLGASLEVTGPIAHMGLAVRIGVETALDEINEKGGVLGQKVRWVYYDDQADPAKAVDNARRIGEKDNCVAMIGGFRTPNAMAIRQPVSEMGLPWVGVMSAGTKVVEWDKNDNKWMFRVSMKDRWVGPYLAENALKRSAAKKVGLLYEATAWGQGAVPDVEAGMKAQGAQLVGKETFNLADQDMSPQLIRLRDAGADTLIYYGVDREATQILRSGERIGYKPKIVSAWGITATLGKTAGPLAEGVVVAGTFAWTGDLSPRARAVWERMKAKFNLESPAALVMPGGTADAYDAVYVVTEGLKIAGAYDRTRLRDSLYKVKHQGIVANYNPAFEPTQERHDAILPTSYKLLVFHQGVLMPIEQTPYGKAN